MSWFRASRSGSAKTDATITQALTDLGVTNRRVLYLDATISGNVAVNTTWTLSNPVTIPSNITLFVSALAQVGGTADLTINGCLVAERNDWWTSSGTLTDNSSTATCGGYYGALTVDSLSVTTTSRLIGSGAVLDFQGTGGFKTTNCQPSTSVTETIPTFECQGWTNNGVYVDQSTSTVDLSAGSGNTWLAAYQDTTTTVSGCGAGNWSRESGTAYIWCDEETQPALPTGAFWIANPQEAAGAISTMVEVGNRLVQGTHTISNARTVSVDSHWKFLPGGIISSSVAVTFNGNFDCPSHQQCFSGAGTIDLTSARIPHAYAEWWGIDGTNDHTEINAALTAAKKVRLHSGKTYALAGSVSAVSNRVLEANDWTTVLTTSTADTGLDVNGVNNFTARGFKIDATAGGVNEVTVQIRGNSSNLRFERLWLEESILHSFRIRPGSGATVDTVHFTDSLISNGNSSASISISPDPAASNQTIQNVFVNRLRLESLDWTGTSINRNAVSDATNVVRRIFFDGYTVNGFGNAGWSFNNGATDCHLTNFFITGGADNAVHLEAGNYFTVTNGRITGNTKNGIRLYGTTEPFTDIGSNDGLISGVTIDNNSRNGIWIAPAAAGFSVLNVTISGNIIHTNTFDGIHIEDGVGITVTGNHIYDNGAPASVYAGIRLPDTDNSSDITIIGNNVYGSNQERGIWFGGGVTDFVVANNLVHDLNADGMYFANVSDGRVIGNLVYDNGGTGITFTTGAADITVKGNSAYDNTTADVSVATSLTTLYGEPISVYFGTLAAGTADRRPALVAGGNGIVILPSSAVINMSTIATDPTDNTAIRIHDGTDVIATRNTITDGFTAETAMPFVTWTAAEMIRATGDEIFIDRIISGAGQATDEMVVILQVMEF